jgi:D-3-phosphoglycerate dehydrogenase
MLERVNKQCLIEMVGDADYLIASGRIEVDHSVLNAAKKLKMVQRTGVGLDSIDLAALKSRQIPLYVSAGINSTSVAEHTLYLMLAVLKQAPVVFNSMRTGQWKKQLLGTECHTLCGKTVGLVGMGSIGKIVARMLQAFHIKLCYYDVIRSDRGIEDEIHAEYLHVNELLSISDVVSLHCPLTPSTINLISTDTISLMKKTSILINTARGGLIEERALVHALESGLIAGAGLDTFEEEPLDTCSILRSMPNVVATPHIAGVSYEAFHDMMHSAFRNIQLFEHGEFGVMLGKRIE